MSYNALAQNYNATYRIGFYGLSLDIQDEIKAAIGDEFYTYYELSSLPKGELLEKPDVIISLENNDYLSKLEKECMAFTLLYEDDIDVLSRQIKENAILGNVMKIKYLSSLGDNLEELLKIVKLKDEHTYNHLINVSKYASMIGTEMRLSEEDVEALRIGGLLYDVGKICLPDSVLFNTSQTLSDSKMDIMQRHVFMSNLLIPSKYSEMVSDIILHHHERLDGSGYPEGIKDISILARIMAVADSYDAITTKCSYQDIHSHEEAMGILEGLSSGLVPKLDSEVVQALERVIINQKTKH